MSNVVTMLERAYAELFQLRKMQPASASETYDL